MTYRLFKAALVAMATFASSQALAQSQAYCQAQSHIPGGTGVADEFEVKQGDYCFTKTHVEGTITNENITIQYIADTKVEASLNNGTIKIDTAIISPGSNATAYASLYDTLYVISPTAGTGYLNAVLSGYIGLAGNLSIHLPGYATINYVDAAFYGVTDRFTAQLYGDATYNKNSGLLSVPIALQEGLNSIPFYAVVSGAGNVSFGHTIGFDLALPQNATFTSESGVFLTESRAPIVGGVFFDLPTAVPEPASWALMIGGFGLVGGAMRRRTLKASNIAVSFA